MKLDKYVKSMRKYDADDVLGLMGLQRSSGGGWVMPMLAGLGAGMAIGAGIAMMLTPYRGDEVRERVRKGASDAQRMLNEQVSSLSSRVSALSEKIGASSGSETTGAIGTSRTIGVGVSSGNRGY